MKHYGAILIENKYFDCWLTNNAWKFGIAIFQYLGFILHCFIIIYSCVKNGQYGNRESMQCYRRSIMTNYFRFIAIYVILWTPAMVVGILDLIIGGDRIPFWMKVLTDGSMISTGTANGILWYINKKNYQKPNKLIKITNKSQPILNETQKRIGINSSYLGLNTQTMITTETITPTKPSDYDPASKIGPRSMYNHYDDTPTMMLIDNTVNQYKCDITSMKITPNQNETGLL